jgi:magnesium transporter
VARRMKTEIIAVPPFWNVGQTIDFLRENTDLPDDFNEVFVVDPTYHLVGILQLHKILRHQRPALVSYIMEEAKHVVQADDEQAEAARLFERYNLISTPVVDDAKRLVGILTIDDIVDVLSEEADSDIKALGGVQADEELTDRVKTVLPSRFTWLFVNLLTALLSSFVISQFAETIKSMVALAVLMPIVASMGGNAGTQTMTVAVRALATQELTHANAWRIIRRELIVGLLNGLAFALIMGIVVRVWYPDVHIFPVIGLAIVITLVAAAFGGIIIPLTLEKMGVDPAISSGPLVTTITDVVGFFTFLGLASLWLVK